MSSLQEFKIGDFVRVLYPEDVVGAYGSLCAREVTGRWLVNLVCNESKNVAVHGD